jgi:hypothetical protein
MTQSWLIVHLTTQPIKGPKAMKLSLKDTVIDKLRSDFGAKQNAERVIQIKAKDNPDDPQCADSWKTLLAKLQSEVMNVFETR